MTATTGTALALPIPNAHFIWYCAWLSIPSAIYAYSHPASAHFAVIPASVWATSLIYWRNPVMNSWRQRIDISVVLSGLTYQTYYAFQYANLAQTYVVLICTAAVCYKFGYYLWTCGCVWPATYAHATIHIIGNIGNLLLYESVRHE